MTQSSPHPLGVTLLPGGANVAVVSRADRVELCVLDRRGRETARHLLPERDGDVHHGFVSGLKVGDGYGFRAHGPWEPERGRRFNPARLLLDPYARAVGGRMVWEGPNLVDADDPFRLDPRDTAGLVPFGIVTEPQVPLAPGPGTGWERTVIYEAHVKGMTALHPAVPEADRGRFAGLAHPAVIEHLVRLGVTAVELLPTAALVDELRLVRLGLVNHWGYNSVAFMAPEQRYAGSDPVGEFRAMAESLHGAGLELILDVVVNHTAETDHLGPTLSFRGLADDLYYRQDPERPGRYLDWAGTGNALNLGEPVVVRLVMDTLRHWAAMGADGFRFDLGAALGRERSGTFRDDAPLLTAIRQDPVLSKLKLIMEPWDLGPGGYRVGDFPPPFAEWNDGFRDASRRFWRGDTDAVPPLAGRFLGSAARFEHNGRRPWASVNYVAAHDGATTRDLVTYAARHNDANGEGNRDGNADEHGANYGVDGPTDDPAIQAVRARQQRNLLSTLLLAQGTPMLLMGDELGRTQRGNNNAYCQDNALSWVDWGAADHGLAAFVAKLTALRREHPALRRHRFLHGGAVVWLAEDGMPMRPDQWDDTERRCVGLVLTGEPALLLLLNAGAEPLPFRLPEGTFTTLLDTTATLPVSVDGSVDLPGRCLVLLAAQASPQT